MNLALLSLAVAGLTGLAGAWFLLDWLRAASAAWPGLAPAGPLAAPWVLLCVAAGAWLGERRATAAPLVASMRWLAGGAVAVLAARWSLEALAPAPGDVPTGWTRTFSAALCAAPAAFVFGALLVQLAAVRRAAGQAPPRALGGVLAAAAAAGAAGALLNPARLLAGSAPWFAPALCLLAGALACGLLAAWEAREAAGASRPGDATDSARGSSVLTAAIAGALCAGAAPALLRVAGQRRGVDVDTTVEVLAVLAGGACVGALLAALVGRPLRGTPLAAWLLLLPAALPLIPDTLPTLLAAGLLGLALGLLVIARVGDGPRAPAWALAGLAAGAGFGLLAQDRLLGAGWTSGAVLRAAALAAATASMVCAASSGALGLRLLALLPGALLAVGLWSKPAAPLPWRSGPDDVGLVRQLEDPRGTLNLVATTEGGTRRTLDGWPLPSGPAGGLTSRRMARLSAALRPEARDALLIGAGDGQLLVGLDELLPGRVRCIEPLGLLVELARATAPPGAAAAAPEQAEPRSFVDAHRSSFDLIVVAPLPPGRRGQGEQLALEHLLALRRAVRAGGVVVQWLPLHQMPWPAFASAAQSFLEAFPETRVFLASLRGEEPWVALAGGLDDGLPGVAQLDAFLGAAPSAAGLSGAPDVFDLYVCDGWTLGGHVRGAAPSTLERPLGELLSMRREDEALALSIMNLRLLAGIAVPLDTVSLAARPVSELENRELGAQLVARSTALRWLLVAQAARLERLAAAAGALSADERGALEEEQAGALLAAWSAAPGHVDVREGLLARAHELAQERRWAPAEALLAAATARLADGRLLGLRAGLLIELGAAEEAVRLGQQAVEAVPGDRTALANLARALLVTSQDVEARAALERAREAFAPAPLPPLHAACLALLEDAPDADATADALLAQMPAGESWAEILRRLRAD